MTTNVCFIGGFGRSGSTLLERLIGELPDVCALGEVVHLWHRGVRNDELCGCGVPFSKCDFWQPVGEVAFGGWDRIDLDRIAHLTATVDRMRSIPASTRGRSGSFGAKAREYAEFYERLYSAAREVSGAQLVTDSSKNASTAYALNLGGHLDMRIVHLVRDSRGVAYSWTKEVARPEAENTTTKKFMDKYSPWKSALLWDAHNVAFAALRYRGVPMLRVAYERAVADTSATVAEVASFLGVDASGVDRFIAQDSVKLSRSHLVAGNPMRFQTGTVLLRSDDAWRSRLRPSDRRTVSVLTAPLLLRYGYFDWARRK